MVNNLGIFYKIQAKTAKTEAMYLQVLVGIEKAWGLKHISTFDTINNLRNLYSD